MDTKANFRHSIFDRFVHRRTLTTKPAPANAHPSPSKSGSGLAVIDLVPATGVTYGQIKTGLNILASMGDGAVSVPGLKAAALIALEVVKTAEVPQLLTLRSYMNIYSYFVARDGQ